DSASITATNTLDTSAASDTGDNPFGSASALGVSGAVSMNDVRGGAKAHLEATPVTAAGGTVSVSATEEATLTAALESAAETSTSGGLFGGGSETAVNALIATNVVQSAAEASITDSTVTNTGGGVSVDAQNTATLEAS